MLRNSNPGPMSTSHPGHKPATFLSKKHIEAPRKCRGLDLPIPVLEVNTILGICSSAKVLPSQDCSRHYCINECPWTIRTLGPDDSASSSRWSSVARQEPADPKTPVQSWSQVVQIAQNKPASLVYAGTNAVSIIRTNLLFRGERVRVRSPCLEKTLMRLHLTRTP